MNPAHLHLIVNHAPIFSIFFGTMALILAMKRNSTELRTFAVGVFILGAMTTITSHLTGEGAEQAVKKISDMSQDIVEKNIHEHEEASDFALGSSILVALASLGMMWTATKKPKHLKKVQIIVLVLALHSCTVMMRVAYLGGMIRHYAEMNSESGT